jgi:hypothetical protein
MQQVLQFLNDAFHIDGLTGRRHRRQVRVKDAAELLAVAAQATTTSFLVTSTFLDEHMEKSLRRRATVPNQVWLDNFKKLSSNAPLCRTSSHEDIEALRDGKDVMYEQRSHANGQASTGKGSDDEKHYLTRRLIKADDYYAAESVAGSKQSTVKFVLSFVIDHQYYELFFFPYYKDPVLDMSDDVQALPTFLELTENGYDHPVPKTVDSGAKASTPTKELDVLPTPARGMAPGAEATVLDEAPQKRRRKLLRYSTQEAACGSPPMKV